MADSKTKTDLVIDAFEIFTMVSATAVKLVVGNRPCTTLLEASDIYCFAVKLVKVIQCQSEARRQAYVSRASCCLGVIEVTTLIPTG